MTNENRIVYQNTGAKHYKNYTPIYNFGKKVELGKYAEMAREYMQQNAPIAYNEYSTYSEFDNMLAQIDHEAIERLYTAKISLRKQYPAPKTNDFALLSKHSSFIESKAEEIVIKEIIYRMHISDDEVARAQNARHAVRQ
ncbi:MAG: TnpV protein [Eubacteriales bacterium]